MKRIISVNIVCAMLASLFLLSVHATGTTVSVGTASCMAGESVSVPITLSGNTGFSNLGIEIEYDNTALTLTNATAGQTGATYTPAQNITIYPYNMGWDSTSNNTFNGTLATLEFDVSASASGSYPIRVSYYKGRDRNYEDGTDVNYDENFIPINLTYEYGAISVSNGTVVLPTVGPDPSGALVKVGLVSGAAGETVSVPITISKNTGFSNLGIEVGYDSSVLMLKSATAGQTGATYTAAQSITTNPYNMGWDSTSNNIFNGTIATLEFEIADSAAAGNYPITVSYYKGRNGNYEDGSDVNYDENFAPLRLSYVTGYVTVSDGAVSGKSIYVDNIRNDSVLAFNANINSDEQITGVIIAALYDSDGKLIALHSYNAESEVDFSFANVSGAETIKVFWWDSMSNMLPQAHCETIRL